MWENLVRYFEPKFRETDENNVSSSTIVINVLLVSFILDFIGSINAFPIGLIIVGQLQLVNAICIVVLLFFYRKNKITIVTLTHIFSALHVTSFSFQAWVQGGLASPAISALFLIPGISMLLAGKKTAVIWSILCAGVIFGYFFFETNYGSPPPYYSEENKLPFYLLSVLGTFISIFVVLMVYENGKAKTLREIKQKHLDLIQTQKRLIQSEKLASLGELTAGIAHEIQNPLNFVNNFSEVSEEMIQEIKEERLKTKDQRDEALEDEILSDIEQNLQKINHHGHRASSIVKGMLEHSRTSSGKKELTNINALADEYLRLAYHGLRAKDKSFQSDFKTDFDATLPKIGVVSQDMGRVFLNLINNAFQATSDEALKRKLNSSENQDSYKPTVSIKTELTANGQLLITITDNGPGISDEIKDKIFQPFFTTKDTGKGTGLGLSLAYDIVKAHGGDLTVESEEGKGSTFLINLLA